MEQVGREGWSALGTGPKVARRRPRGRRLEMGLRIPPAVDWGFRMFAPAMEEGRRVSLLHDLLAARSQAQNQNIQVVLKIVVPCPNSISGQDRVRPACVRRVARMWEHLLAHPVCAGPVHDLRPRHDGLTLRDRNESVSPKSFRFVVGGRRGAVYSGSGSACPRIPSWP